MEHIPRPWRKFVQANIRMFRSNTLAPNLSYKQTRTSGDDAKCGRFAKQRNERIAVFT